MQQPFAQYCRMVSRLLHYPDAALAAETAQIGRVAAQMPAGALKEALEGFTTWLPAQPLLDLQQRYTDLFDLNPALTLNLACHLPGDPRAQAARMARLQEVYLAAGYEKISGELPDYLPLVLEFLALAPQGLQQPAVSQVLAGVQPLVERLQKHGPAYAALLRPLPAEVKKRTLEDFHSLRSANKITKPSARTRRRRAP